MKAGWRKYQVREEQINGPFVLHADFESFRTAISLQDGKSSLLQNRSAETTNSRFIIDDQDGG